MNAAALHHPKLLDLADALVEHYAAQQIPLPAGVAHTLAVGLLDQLWLFAEEYAPAGDVGRYTDAQIARALHWSGDAAWLIATLVELRWLDRCDARRLVVHNWSTHAPRTCDRRLADAGQTFADGAAPRCRPRRAFYRPIVQQARPAAAERTASADCGDLSQNGPITPGSYHPLPADESSGENSPRAESPPAAPGSAAAPAQTPPPGSSPTAEREAYWRNERRRGVREAEAANAARKKRRKQRAAHANRAT